ncbi:MAG: hypothetical protein JNG88_16735 [Phycisphaerales bacterium]|nr:hypothetical protein [Phycisphaerales bacterium]
MFAGVDLARRIEAGTCKLHEESARQAARRLGQCVFARPLAGGVAVYAEPGSPLNKIAGLGFGGALGETEIGEIEQAYAQRGCAVQVELSSLGDPAIGAMLSRRGYVLMGHEHVLGLPLRPEELKPRSPVAREIEVTLSDKHDFEKWLDVVVSGFASPDDQGIASHESFPRDVIRNCMADMCAVPGFARYMAGLGGEPAGGASLYTGAGIAQLCGAATLPQHRRKGVQTALFETRLCDAAATGCDLAVITTMPGSKSQENAQRRGFALLYSRAVMVKPAE